MKKIIAVVLAAVLLLTGLAVGCDEVVIGSGKLTTKSYDFTNFKNVEFSSAFSFDVSRSDSYSVSITADDNVMSRVTVTQTGSTLKIGLNAIANLGHVTLKASLTMPELARLNASGACRGTISDFSSTQPFDVNASGASTVTGDIDAGDTSLNVSGASVVQLEGTGAALQADASGASRINLAGFEVNRADITLSGASSGTVNTNGRLDANLSGASRLVYSGSPQMGNINTSGASSLTRK